MSVESILKTWQKKTFQPVYWLEGEENFFIDQVMDFAEHQLLSEAEQAFNLNIFYGKDAQWADVINACRRYPMLAEKQVVLLKEAQQMRDLDKLEAYLEAPSPTTIFVVSYKDKKLDGRTSMAKTLKKKAEILTTKKLYDSQLPEWTNQLIQSKDYTIEPKALTLLVDHIGNDLSRLNNEIDKLLLNLGKRKKITEDDIEKYVGVSKEYNPFELQAALVKRDFAKAIRIIQYFESNPKAAPIQLILPTLYNLFSKAYQVFGLPSQDEKTVATQLGVNPFFVKDYLLTARQYGFEGVEAALLLLHHYNLKSVGITDPGTTDASLLKEMIVKIISGSIAENATP